MQLGNLKYLGAILLDTLFYRGGKSTTIFQLSKKDYYCDEISTINTSKIISLKMYSSKNDLVLKMYSIT